jgi:hypothetical protein
VDWTFLRSYSRSAPIEIKGGDEHAADILVTDE